MKLKAYREFNIRKNVVEVTVYWYDEAGTKRRHDFDLPWELCANGDEVDTEITFDFFVDLEKMVNTLD